MLRRSSSVQLCSTAQRKYSCVGTSSLSISPLLCPLPYIHVRFRERLNFLKVRTGHKVLTAASAEETRLWTEYFSLRSWYFFFFFSFLSRNYVSSDSDVLAACLFFSNSLTSLRSSPAWRGRPGSRLPAAQHGTKVCCRKTLNGLLSPFSFPLCHLAALRLNPISPHDPAHLALPLHFAHSQLATVSSVAGRMVVENEDFPEAHFTQSAVRYFPQPLPTLWLRWRANWNVFLVASFSVSVH